MKTPIFIVRIVLVIFCFHFVQFSLGQSNNKELPKKNTGVRVLVNVGGFSQIPNTKEKDPSIVYGFRLRASVTYHIIKQLSLGVSAEIAPSYSNYNKASIVKLCSSPIQLEANYYILDRRNTPFIYAAGGYQIRYNYRFMGGQAYDAGIGYKFFASKKFCMAIKLGYSYRNYIQLTDTPYYRSNEVNFSIGCIF